LISKKELKSAMFEVVFGLFDLSDDQTALSGTHKCLATRHVFTNDCLECYFFDEQSFTFTDVPWHAGIRLVLEVRLIPDPSLAKQRVIQPPKAPLDLPRSSDDLERTAPVKPRGYCWSIFTPFSADGRQLDHGEWRLNLFPPPLFTQITVEEMRKLEVLPHSFLYIRLLDPRDSSKQQHEQKEQLTLNMREKYKKKDFGLLDYFSKSPQELMETDGEQTEVSVKKSIEFSALSIPTIASINVNNGSDKRIRVLIERFTRVNMPVSLMRNELVDDISVRPMPDQLINFNVKIGQLMEQREIIVPLLSRTTKCYILLQLVGGVISAD
jgi:hypothetical protein